MRRPSSCSRQAWTARRIDRDDLRRCDAFMRRLLPASPTWWSSATFPTGLRLVAPRPELHMPVNYEPVRLQTRRHGESCAALHRAGLAEIRCFARQIKNDATARETE